MPKHKSSQRYLYPWHRKRGTGMAFREWLRRRTGLPTQGPVSLMQINEAINEHFAFDNTKDRREAIQACAAELLRRGYGTALYNYESSTWEWTDRFTLPDLFSESPEGIAAAAVASWLAFGDSGGAEDLRLRPSFQPMGRPFPASKRRNNSSKQRRGGCWFLRGIRGTAAFDRPRVFCRLYPSD
jgi:hypothetical protein